MTRTFKSIVAMIVSITATIVFAETHTQRFDTDPGWDGHNNRSTVPAARTVTQDFGFSPTSHAGGERGEMGGMLFAAAEPAFYAKKIPQCSFEDSLTASGTLFCDGKPTHALIGFFNSSTLNEWRTPNSIALRISGRDKVFYAWLEYATKLWRAGGDDPRGFTTEKDPQTGRAQMIGFASGVVHKWSMKYDPRGNQGAGSIEVTIDDVTAVCHVDPGHRKDDAVFNRFGLLNVMKSADSGGGIWLDDVTVNGVTEHFTRDPNWDHLNNRRTYVSTNIRPRFDFGYSPTRYAGGKAAGEIGGLIFRGDNRYPERMAYNGDRVGDLNLEMPLKASGRVCLRRGVSDSTVLIGFFHSKDSMIVNQSQAKGIPDNFIGVAIEGPSREGFQFYPVYDVSGKANASSRDGPHIYPDGSSHEWTFEYLPDGANGRGLITVTLDGKPVRLELSEGNRAIGARFDRFGFVTTWIDGNGQLVYFDDLSYTSEG